MSTRLSNLQLFNLDDPLGGGDFEFRRFPREISTDDQTNWEEQDVAGSVKPLLYANVEPQKIEIQEVWLDSATNESVLPDIERLRALMRPGRNGAPPRLQLVCGDWSAVVVLRSLKAERTRFTSANVQTRARLSLTFCEVQYEAPRPGNRPEDALFSF